MSAPPIVALPDPATRAPTFKVPPRSCDCHAHVCGPVERYPLFAERIYSPADTPVAHYVRMLEALGIERAVLVQPSFYASDNSALLDGLRHAGSRFRGVAVIAESITDRELHALHEAGVRGVRFNIVDLKQARGVLPMERLQAIAQRIRSLGWHIELLMHVDEFPDLDVVLGRLPVDVVLGHLGYVPCDKRPDEPGFQALLRLMRTGKAWVKLTGPYRISRGPLPHSDTVPFAQALLEAAPERLVWGSDWPHVMTQWRIPMPNDADLLDLLMAWAPDEAVRHKILVDNPHALYGFD